MGLIFKSSFLKTLLVLFRNSKFCAQCILLNMSYKERTGSFDNLCLKGIDYKVELKRADFLNKNVLEVYRSYTVLKKVT